MSKIETTQLTQDLSICRILNGMWQVSGGHGQIDHDSAINQMLEYAENGFNTWDMADIYGPAESLYGNFRNEFEKRKGNRLPTAPLEMEITLVPSISFYPDFIQILFRFDPNLIQI